MIPYEVMLGRPELTLEFLQQLKNELIRLSDQNKLVFEDVEQLKDRVSVIEGP